MTALDPNSTEAKQENARRRVQELVGEYHRVLKMLYDTMNDQFIAKPDTLHVPMGLTAEQMRGTISNIEGIEDVQRQVADLLNTIKPGTVTAATPLQAAKPEDVAIPRTQRRGRSESATQLPTQADLDAAASAAKQE